MGVYASSFLRNTFVCKKGKIYPWGMIRILSNKYGVLDDDETNGLSFLSAGLACWSPQLVPFGKDHYTAEILVSDVAVLKNGKYVTKVPFTEFFIVDAGEYHILNNGFLFHMNNMGSKEYVQMYENALNDSLEGKKPQILDNSVFMRVDKKYSGQTVVGLDFGYKSENTNKVFTMDGKLVPCSVGCPLSFKKWEPQNPLALYSID